MRQLLQLPVLSLLVFLASGCISYQAPIHAKVQRGELDVTLQAAAGKPDAMTSEARLLLSIDAVPEGVTLVDASVRAPGEAPCGDGSYASAWGRSSGRKAEQPLVAGETIALKLPGDALETLATGPSRLDVSLRTPEGELRCVPLPITDDRDGLPFEATGRFTLAGSFSLEGFTSKLGSVQQFITLPLLLGAWIDRVHVSAGFGLFSSGCPDTRCPIDDGSESKIDYSAGYMVLGGADTVLWEAGEIGVGAGLQYRVAQVSADTFAGQNSEQFWMHGPALVPSFLVVLPVLKPYEIGGSRAGQIAFEVPVGYAITEGHGNSLTIGFNARFQFTVL